MVRRKQPLLTRGASVLNRRDSEYAHRFQNKAGGFVLCPRNHVSRSLDLKFLSDAICKV